MSFALFFIWAHAVPAKFALGIFAVSRLLAHSFAANFVLANFTDSTPQILRRLGTHHTFFGRFSHSGFLSVQYFNLLGIFENDLQPVLRMIFDQSADFDVAIFEALWRLLAFFEKLRRGIEDDRSQSFA